ncbi:MAG TPA: hypothetical protein VIO57_07220, partial [Chloroflexota bacterium]
YSPNAAFVTTTVALSAGSSYTIKLVWKANRADPGTIWAGAGPSNSGYSPTRLIAELVPTTASTAGSCPGSQAACMQSMLAILNTDRAKVGVAPLTLNQTESNGTSTCVGAYGHSVHMSQVGSISHDQFPADICIPYQTAGENVGESASGNELTDLQNLDNLMMSEPHDPTTCSTTVNHACNTINPKFTQVGIGIYYINNTTWLSEDFTN